MKVLLAIDSSPGSEAVVHEAAVRPWPEGASFEVLNVVESTPPWTMSEILEEATRHARALVQGAAERLRARGRNAGSVVLSGDPKAVIVDHARETHADLILAGSHGNTGLTRFLLGGVSRAVVRFAPCSVGIVRPASRSGAGEGMRVLLATDGSEHSRLAACSIATRPWPAGTEVRILSAVELSLTDFQAAFEPPFLDAATKEQLRAEAMKRAQDAIAAAQEVLANAGVQTSESISILVKSPKQIILDEAKEWHAGLIVLGSHGRRGVSRFMLGSVSEAVATHAECTVEVIRAA